MITVGILYADFFEDNENSIKGGRMRLTSGFWGVFYAFLLKSAPHAQILTSITAELIDACSQLKL